MKKVTFIHTADLHLDSPMVGLHNLPNNIFKQLQESTFTSFTKLVDLAIARQVDFVLIVGDLFDSEDRSVRAQVRFRQEMERLCKEDIKVFISHGNHDHLNSSWTMVNMPSNVHTFATNVEKKQFTTITGTTVNLYGFSYKKRHIYDDMTTFYKKTGEADYHIGLLHGHAEGVSEHSRYAPFKITNLLNKHFDYWALGHIHKTTILHENPYIVYPGNIQGRHRSEIGPKGCYIVSLVENETKLEWLDTAAVVWDEIKISAVNINDFDSLYEQCLVTLNEQRQINTSKIVSIKITELQDEQLIEEVNNGELLSLLQEQEQTEQPFIYPATITVEEDDFIPRNKFLNEANFYNELFNTIDSFNEWDEALQFLYDHHEAKRYLDKLTDKEKDKLLKEAEQILLKLLHNK